MASDKLSFNLGLAKTPEIKTPELFGELVRIYNAIDIIARKVDINAGTSPIISPTLTYYGGNKKLSGVVFDEDVSEGFLIQFVAGVDAVHAKLANSSNVHGYCATSGGVLSGFTGEVVLDGIYPYGAGSFTPFTTYYSAAAGAINTSGTKSIGYALTPNLLLFKL